jgi:hypothetical protein
MMNISIDSCRNGNDSCFALILEEVISKINTVSEGVGGSNEDQPCNLVLYTDL